MKRKRERLEDAPRRKSTSGFRYYARPKKKDPARKRLRKRERLYIFEPASQTFTDLFQEMGSINPRQRHAAARRLAAHCAVVFRES